MTSESLKAFGGAPEPFPRLDTLPLHFFETEWEWLRPFAVILKLNGWTVDDVASNPRVAAQVRLFWKIYKMGQRQSHDRQKGVIRHAENR